jgi:tetrapyrrole methylase family protein/MazG family protein
LLEETYEALEALDAGHADKLCEELGDILIQVLLHAVIAAEQGEFDLETVARVTSDKLIRRHPHVFGSVEVSGAGEVVHNWEQIKRGEEGNRSRTSALDGVPQPLPGLARAWSVQKKAARVGFDWDDDRGPWAKLREELAELEAAQATGEAEQVEAELGDVLFAVVNLSRFLPADPEAALRTATNRFSQRFRRIEALAAAEGQCLKDLALAEMDVLWERAKQDEDESEER